MAASTDLLYPRTSPSTTSSPSALSSPIPITNPPTSPSSSSSSSSSSTSTSTLLALNLNPSSSHVAVPFAPLFLQSPLRSNSDGQLLGCAASSCPLSEPPSIAPRITTDCATKERANSLLARPRWSSDSGSDCASDTASTTSDSSACSSPPRADLLIKNSLWNRVGKQVSTVGKGLLKDRTAKVLLEEHWLEAADPKHRYGTLLRSYHAIWKETDSMENFFHWLDYGPGKDLDLPSSPRAKLDSSGVVYLDSKQRANCLVAVRDGRLIYARSGEPLHTYSEACQQPEKFIFVVDPAGRFYAAKKVKGKFHHSSFLSGGTAKAAGNLTVTQGMLTRISRASGHYRPSEGDLLWMLELLRSRGVDTSRVTIEDFD